MFQRCKTAYVFGQKAEALESGTKQFEELEFCQLEEESSLDEKKETQSQQILQKRAEYHCSVAKRKVGIHVHQKACMCLYNMVTNMISMTWHVDSQERMAALDAQVKQLGLQAAQDSERITKDRTVTLQILHKVRLSTIYDNRDVSLLFKQTYGMINIGIAS